MFSVPQEGGQQWPAPTCNRRSVVSRKRNSCRGGPLLPAPTPAGLQIN